MTATCRRTRSPFSPPPTTFSIAWRRRRSWSSISNSTAADWPLQLPIRLSWQPMPRKSSSVPGFPSARRTRRSAGKFGTANSKHPGARGRRSRSAISLAAPTRAGWRREPGRFAARPRPCAAGAKLTRLPCRLEDRPAVAAAFRASGRRYVRQGARTGVVISSVVPTINPALVEASRRYLKCEPVMVGPGVKTSVRIRYDNPKDVGADRIANALAAYTKYGGPVVVIDFGTAVTYDAINAEGDYLGGAIAP